MPRPRLAGAAKDKTAKVVTSAAHAQGAKSVEVRPVGISKGLAMSRIVAAIVERSGAAAVQYDFVLVAGHFLARDENIFTFFEGQSLKARCCPDRNPKTPEAQNPENPGYSLLRLHALCSKHLCCSGRESAAAVVTNCCLLLFPHGGSCPCLASSLKRLAKLLFAKLWSRYSHSLG